MELTSRKLWKSPSQILLPILVMTISITTLGDGVRNTLLCYQCVIQGIDESECDNELWRCPDDRAYDTCVTNVLKNQTTGEFMIIKRCALAPCQFESDVERALGFLDKCILSHRDPDCVKCCSTDGCNKRLEPALAHQLATNSVKLQPSMISAFQIGIQLGLIYGIGKF